MRKLSTRIKLGGMSGEEVFIGSAHGRSCHVAGAGPSHMRKSVTAKLGDSEVTLQYFTAPINMEHVGKVAVGDFRRGAGFKVGADLQAGETTIAAGDYTVGCIRDGEKAWTMVLSPGQLRRGESPDREQTDQAGLPFSTEMGSVDHVTFDISRVPGPFPGVLRWSGDSGTTTWQAPFP